MTWGESLVLNPKHVMGLGSWGVDTVSQMSLQFEGLKGGSGVQQGLESFGEDTVLSDSFFLVSPDSCWTLQPLLRSRAGPLSFPVEPGHRRTRKMRGRGKLRYSSSP